MPLSVTSICERTLRECGLPTQAAYVGTQTGDLLNRAAAEIAQLPYTRPRRFATLTLASQAPIVPVSITRSGATATVTTPAAHGRTTGDLVQQANAVPAGFNGQYPITVTGPTTYTYVMPADPGGNATTVGTSTHIAHGLPSDFRAAVPETAYIEGNSQRVYWPIDPSDWATLKAGFIDPGVLLLVRQLGGYLYFIEPPPGETFVYEYQSNALFSDSAGFTLKQRITADSDIWLLDDDLLMMNLKWRVKKERGLDDWNVDAGEWRAYSRNLIGETNGARALIFGRPTEHGNGEPYFNNWAR